MAVFCFFSFFFASFHFRFTSDFYVSHRCETSEKSTFFSHRSEKNFASVSLHFASKRKWRRTLTVALQNMRWILIGLKQILLNPHWSLSELLGFVLWLKPQWLLVTAWLLRCRLSRQFRRVHHSLLFVTGYNQSCQNEEPGLVFGVSFLIGKVHSILILIGRLYWALLHWLAALSIAPQWPVLKGLSHQFEFGLKWYGWKEQKLEKTRWGFLKLPTVPWTFNKYKQKHGASEKRDGSCHVLANSRWAILPVS